MQRRLEQLAGFLEGQMLAVNGRLDRYDKGLERVQAVVQQHHDLHRSASEMHRQTHARLTALEGKVTAQHQGSPALAIMREVMPLKQWAAAAALAVMFLTGIVSAEDIKREARDYLLGSHSAPEPAHASP